MRIRTIKPEFWTDKKVASWPLFTRLFFIGLWSAADDWGCGSAEIERLAAQLFPYDLSRDSRETLAKVSESLKTFLNDERIKIYRSDGELYFEICHWKKHQKIDHPGKRSVPAPSESSYVKLARTSRESRETVAPGTGNREQGTCTLPPPADVGVPATKADDQKPIQETSPVDSGTAPPPAEPPEVKPKRPRNDLLDALVGLDGSDPIAATSPCFSAAAKALKIIKEVTPGVTVDEIVRRGENYRRHMPRATISPNAIAKHWSLCDRPPEVQELFSPAPTWRQIEDLQKQIDHHLANPEYGGYLPERVTPELKADYVLKLKRIAELKSASA